MSEPTTLLNCRKAYPSKLRVSPYLLKLDLRHNLGKSCLIHLLAYRLMKFVKPIKALDKRNDCTGLPNQNSKLPTYDT